MRDQDKDNGGLTRTLGTLATILNMTVAVIVTFEAVVRICSFLRTWKPAQKRRMGFGKEAK